jgi:Mn2+/Fe2+ NRAMP family transporter
VINGIVAVPLMTVILILVSRKSVMGSTASWSLRVLGWAGTAFMAFAAIGVFLL